MNVLLEGTAAPRRHCCQGLSHKRTVPRWEDRRTVYSFARVGAAVTMKGGDYFQHRKGGWLRLHEKAASATRFPVILVWRKLERLDR